MSTRSIMTCDRCGAETTFDHDSKTIPLNWHRVEQWGREEESNAASVYEEEWVSSGHLCPKCISAMEKFMKGEWPGE